MQASEAGLRLWDEGRRPKWRSAVFFAAYAIAAGVGFFATYFAVSGAGPVGPASPAMIWLLGVCFLLILGLAGMVVARILAVAGGARAQPETGGRLHLRFVLLFSVAAVAPAVVVALFLGATLSRGVDQWFSERVQTVVEDAASVARAYLEIVREDVRGELLAMAGDMNSAAPGLQSDADAYGRYLAEQARFRSFTTARVLNRQSVLAEAQPLEGAPAPASPAARDFEAADQGEMLLREGRDGIIGLIRLEGYSDAYLQVARPYNPDIIARLTRWSDSTEDYRRAEDKRARLQTIFILSYLAITLLVLVGAMWVGLLSATRIAAPIGRLSEAARRVAGGDLRARVSVRGDLDEVDALGRAFNGMTAQLEAQRADLVHARQEAERRSGFIQAVLSGVSAGVIGLDRDGRVTAANSSAAALLGLEERSLDGRRLVDAAPEFAEILAEPPVDGGEARGVAISRGERTVHLSVRIARDPKGAGLVITFDDMTKLVAAQRVEAWKDVARRIAHEIKNPLTPIQLSAERLRRKYLKEIQSDPETFERCTQTILRQVSDIGRMVDEFSALARMPVPRFTEEDLGDLVRTAAYAQSIAFDDIDFPVETPDGAPLAIACDGRLIAQAYGNVLKNAAEAIQARRAAEGEPKEGRVITRILASPDALVIEISDNGVGFPAQDRERLVEPYVTTRAKGTGLGLAIVRRIAEDHGGLLELDDAPIGGALVRIVLPRRATPQSQPPEHEGSHVD